MEESDLGELPPPAQLFRLLGGYMITQSLGAIARLGVADLLVDGPMSVRDIAARSGANADALQRMLRALASVGVFRELDAATFAHTPLSALLAESAQPSMKHLAMLFSGHLYRAWEEAERTLRTGEPVFEHVFGATHFDYLEKAPEALDVFTQAMSAGAQARVAQLLLADWTRPQRVVDMGGGDGTLLVGLLLAHPTLEGVVFDRPEMLERAREKIAKAGLSERCRFVGGDFLKDDPPEGDTYVFARVLHDWDDATALSLLKRCRRIMSDTGRVLVLDDILSVEDNGFQPAKLRDLIMLVILGGRERSRPEWEALLGAADLSLERALPGPDGGLLEATCVPRVI